MGILSIPADQSREHTLARLFWLRNVMLSGLLALMLWSDIGIGVVLPWPGLMTTLALLALLNAFTALRIRQRVPARAPEIFMQLLADLAGLTVLLMFTGGWANPFVSLLLVPVVMSALLLPPRLAWLAGGCGIAAYTLVAYINLPLGIPPEKAFYLHVSGMWFNFAVSVVVIVFMVLKLRSRLLDRERRLVAFREDNLRKEQLTAVALTAAGAAHDLGTPLNTMAVLNESLMQTADISMQEDLQLMQNQIDRCRALLKNLSHSAQQAVPVPMRADLYLQQLAEKWRLLRPAVQVETSWQPGSAPILAPPASLDQALINLLNNAADASPGPVRLQGRTEGHGIRLDILDTGSGPVPALRALAEPGQSSKDGLGLGLFLSNASIEALGGQVSLSERATGGTCVSIWLPLSGLEDVHA